MKLWLIRVRDPYNHAEFVVRGETERDALVLVKAWILADGGTPDDEFELSADVEMLSEDGLPEVIKVSTEWGYG